MNKKKLSVVMAGAMLASSVAPVLAAEVQKSEHSANELGLLQKELRDLVNSKVFAADDATYKNQSVYAIYVNGIPKTQLGAGASQDVWQGVFNTLTAGDKVEVYSKGFIEKDGKYYHNETKIETPKYTETSELEELANSTSKLKTYTKLIKSVKYDSISSNVYIEFKGDTGVLGEVNNAIEIGLNHDKLKMDSAKDFYYYTNEAKTTTAKLTNTVEPQDFYGFVTESAKTVLSPVPSEKLREITITEGGYDYNISDLYDGLMLTTEGHDFFNLIKEAKSMGRTVTIKGNKKGEAAITNKATAEAAIKMVDEKGRFSITFGKHTATGLEAETYTITGTNKENLVRLASWMVQPLARVDILAGDNRYETAVEIAKEYAGLTGPTNKTLQRSVKNLVLVNGDALVDGLAAAPLAASKTNTVNGKTVSAPILLTEADALPKATKAYLRELMADNLVGDDKEITINLVGGESVLNKSLERELKALGFAVERFGGDNREETSLEVAKEVSKETGSDNIFVVGAEGEADAMSVAAVAASKDMPIVVAKKGGISEDALYELKGKTATVIGGKTVVTESDYNAIKSVTNGITRVYGSNRQGTNAEIIKKYYKNNFLRAENVIVAKDGQRNKTELVDALAAANMASEKKAPIVLATSKLSKAQESALELNANDAEALYQVGHGVSRDVVKTIAVNLGLSNRY